MLAFRRRRPGARLPSSRVALVPGGESVLGAVPLDADGVGWVVATSRRLLVLDRDCVAEEYGWDRIDRGRWDGEERTLTLDLLHGGAPLVLRVPSRVAQEGRDVEVDERSFSVALRQCVNAAIIHHVSGTLPGGLRATASVRRGVDGVLYSVTDPSPADDGGQGVALGAADVEALRGLENRVRDGVGLPT